MRLFAAVLAALLLSCSKPPEPKPMNQIPHDVHSYANPNAVKVTHVSLDLEVFFERQSLQGSAVLTIEHIDPKAKEIVLDSRALQIDMAEASDDGVKYREAHFETGKPDPILGTALHIPVGPQTKFIRIRYSTSPSATALQWLAPEQTEGKQHPFLYTQGEAINTRSWIPLQDSPGVRVTYDAKIKVPEGARAVMSAVNCPDKPNCVFKLEHAVPPYLIALAVGDLQFIPTGPRTGVWAEPSIAAKAAEEFADTEKMVAAAEKLYGPYRWGRYDVLVLPPSFPFGGMENPLLTFATPTILAGDKSLVSLVAHELAHSWSGNLVSNATWSDFWLNEGYTTYIERRILEELYGKERAMMEASLGYDDLMGEFKTLSSGDQALHPKLDGRDPDDGMNSVPYEKGALFLRTLEAAHGREKFDAFLKGYFDHFAFQSITTSEAMTYLQQNLGPVENLKAWLYQGGLPKGVQPPVAEAFTALQPVITNWLAGKEIDTSSWNTHQWLHFLQGLPEKLDAKRMARLDKEFHLTAGTNDEILAQWLLMAARNRYTPAEAKLEEFLTTVGRRKYVVPLYKALDKKQATAIYAKARPGYHSMTRQPVDAMLGVPSN